MNGVNPDFRPCGSPVVTAPGPAPLNGQCADSPSKYEIGSANLPAGMSGWATTIGNIFGFENAEGEIYGWVYETEDQHIYFQRNPADTGVQALAELFDSIPGLNTIAGSLLDATTAPYELTAQQWANIASSLHSGGWGLHKCYSAMFNGSTAS